MPPTLARIAAAGALLAACAHRPGPPPIELKVAGDDAGCRFEAEGRIVGAGPSAETMLAEAARRWRGRSVIILGGAEVPYKCFGLAVYVLQREMVDGRIGFISEPPPEPD
ncbi:MAG TPA: hypothetical protein VF548_11440 [Allosphingosinicella sp.]|jgi:hypothetical protein